ncbi:exported hypothetical protein [Frankia canadensis]|uniref:Uncharacterized protein n=1 Tax=Frankia canadensis TaxID=1836972 RepID=A0A2I2KQL2_9ACTN|nr:exported hypothetical protein [Frankia canadensis]SOU55245.1 exported hypothetical protein [Frankia canadensis]
MVPICSLGTVVWCLGARRVGSFSVAQTRHVAAAAAGSGSRSGAAAISVTPGRPTGANAIYDGTQAVARPPARRQVVFRVPVGGPRLVGGRPGRPVQASGGAVAVGRFRSAAAPVNPERKVP